MGTGGDGSPPLLNGDDKGPTKYLVQLPQSGLNHGRLPHAADLLRLEPAGEPDDAVQRGASVPPCRGVGGDPQLREEAPRADHIEEPLGPYGALQHDDDLQSE
jgi:hypothetical protein